MKRPFLLLLLAATAALADDSPANGDIFGAIHNRDLAAVNAYLRADPDCVFATNKAGMTALHYAARIDEAAAAYKLLKAGADANARTGGTRTTPLQWAADKDSIDTLNVLVRHGAELDAADCWGRTPVCTAASERIRLYLAKLGANLRVQATDGRTPLHFALGEGCTPFAASELHRLGADAGVPDALGNTPLHYADSPSQAAVLIDKGGADPNRSNNYGETPLEYQKRLKGSGASVTRFLRGKARPSARPVPELAP